MHRGYKIERYDSISPFASFLPGIAGKNGVPMWAYYVNRGQAVSSFGIRDKDHAIMEFSPAVIAYEDTARKGFRTFIKTERGEFEAFSEDQINEVKTMCIYDNLLSIESVCREWGIKTEVQYCMLPYENFAALIRKVTVENLLDYPQHIWMLDGMARVIPYGVLNSEFKDMANLLKSYSKVQFLGQRTAVYSSASSVSDSAEVEDINGGYFYCIHADSGARILADPELVFGNRTDLGVPQKFYESTSQERLMQKQYCENKIPCAFLETDFVLEPGESRSVYALVGFSGNEQKILYARQKMQEPGWIEEKIGQAKILTYKMTDEIETQSALPLYDEYIRQCYLDNLLRGGYPWKREGSGTNFPIVHLFSRKHGDLERDYNYFVTQDVKYSQGNGNFRDVCQNRRDEIFFHPEIGTANMEQFVNLLQADGYNPLEINPDVLCAEDKNREFIQKYAEASGLHPDQANRFCNKLKQGMNPGEIWAFIEANIQMQDQEFEIFLEEIAKLCRMEQRAVFKEGYWTDHWTYVPEHVENYFKMFPENRKRELFENRKYLFYNSPARVLPRDEKYCLKNGGVYQYGAVIKDEQKKWNLAETHWLEDYEGKQIKVCLFEKLYLLALLKASTLDPEQKGIEMEAGKPGWNDAFNGLPGLLGSSSSEMIDLIWLLDRLKEYLNYAPEEITVLSETEWFDSMLQEQFLFLDDNKINSYEFWDTTRLLNETWREKSRFSLSGRTITVTVELLKERLKTYKKVIQSSIQKQQEEQAIIPTYYVYKAESFEKLMSPDGKILLTPYGLPKVKVKEFSCEKLPVFLESPAKLIRFLGGGQAEAMYSHIKDSGLYDKKMGMYKTSEPIDSLGIEVGRIRSFSPGWFERESIFLHMEYKYLLALMDAKLYDIYYQEMKCLLVPFMDEKVYGRSILENSSFIVSSEDPNPSKQGKGYVSRLSGSAAEVISMWLRMFVGEKMFSVQEGKLCFTFSPVLHKDMFREDGTIEIRFLGSRIIYKNKSGKSTYGSEKGQVERLRVDGQHWIIGDSLNGQNANKLRNKKIRLIEVDIQ